MGTEVDEPSLLQLTKEFIKEKAQKPGNVFLGVVSRIDAFVSGVLLFAKTSKAASRLSEQFRNSSVKKIYYAVLEGRPPVEGSNSGQRGTLVSWLRKNDRLRRVESFSQPVQGAKPAELDFEIIQTIGHLSLVKIDLKTGRKHQIRAQFSDLGCPVYGDRKYDAQETMGTQIALHSWQLTVLHPTLKKPFEFSATFPQSWRQNRKISNLISGI